MNVFKSEQITTLPSILLWLIIASGIGLLAGCATAFFLASLDWATTWRETHPLIILALPISGMAVGLLYHYFGTSVERGNNLLIDEIHDPQKVIPLRMAPLVLLGTISTHLFGGSAGREGTAVQMGGALADQITHLFKFSPQDRRIILMAGISAGFSAVFGTPLAGALFGLEVLAIGKLRYDALFPCLIAAVVADQTTRLWGIHHTAYAVDIVPALTFQNILLIMVAGAVFGVIGMLFATCTHHITGIFKRRIKYAPLRPFVGGALVAAGVFALDTTQFIGLGIPTISASFEHPLPWYDFAAKFLFTTVTLGAGFKGGEVTPLFFIGATLGNALAYVLHLPLGLLAGLGFVGVFAGAANTPIACTLMAMELFGADIGCFAAIACVSSYLFSGHTGIYRAQRIGAVKHHTRYRLKGWRLVKTSHPTEPTL